MYVPQRKPILIPPGVTNLTDSSAPTQIPSSHLSLIASLFPQALAPSTLRNYRQLALRCERFAERQGLDPWAEGTWIAFIHGLSVAASGRLSYLKVASAIIALRHRPLLSLAVREACASGGLIATRQAPPLSRHHLEHPLLLPHRLPLLIAWKSASRWDEVTRLHRSCLDVVEQEAPEVIIDWGQATKASRLDPHRASRWTALRGNDVPEIVTLLSPLAPNSSLTTLSTAALTALLRRAWPELNLSAHSIKAGAIDTLARAVETRQLPLALLHRTAKHKTATDPTSTTLRYVRDHRTLARLLGTGEATALL